ncbi:MAG: N-acetylglucosamine-6-phosphate deacetylase [Pseudomonadales bacterium]
MPSSNANDRATALVNGQIFTGDAVLSDQAAIIADAKVTTICPAHQIPAEVEQRFDLAGGLLLPGFVDLQVNGGGGALFNDAPSVETIATIAEAHRDYGTSGFLPTLISDDFDTMRAAILAVDESIEQGVPGVLGVHLEGPFLNPQRKGAHNADKFRYIDEEAIELLTSLQRGKTLITIAPELTTTETIRRLVGAGVLVSGGHSAASYAETRSALDAGLSSFTHLFNAMSQLGNREPGMLGAALEDEHSYCGIIVDGYHVHAAALRVALAAKPKGKIFLVTDAMPTVGTTGNTFVLNGETIHSDNGRFVNSDGTLAGSDLNMLDAVRNSIKMLDVNWQEAVRMASSYPARYLGMEERVGYIKPGQQANFVLVDENFDFVAMWIKGEKY